MRLLYFILLCTGMGLGACVRSCAGCRTTPPRSESNFCATFPTSCRRELPVLLTVPQSKAHLYGTPPDSGLVRSTRARFPGTASVLLLCAELPRAVHRLCSRLSGNSGPRARPGARPEGCFCLRFLLMELMKLIWDSVCWFYFCGSPWPCCSIADPDRIHSIEGAK